MDESTESNHAAAPATRTRFAFIRNLPDRFPRTTKTFAAIGVVATGVVGAAVVKSVKKTDIELVVNDDVVLDTHSTTDATTGSEA